MVIDLHLASGVEAPAEARRGLAELADSMPREMLDDLRLLVSELVTNSIRHAGQGPEGWVAVRVSADPRAVRVEVRDPGPGFAARGRVGPPKADRTSGRGLFLVAQIADRWGVNREDETRVWFEIDRNRR